jgi:hypothetical protein
MVWKSISWVLEPLLSISLVAQQMPQGTAPPTPAAPATQPLPAQPQTYEHTLQDGTPVKLQLSKTLSSADAEVGQEISFEVVDDIDVDGVTVLRAGAPAIGRVIEAVPKKRMGRAGKLIFNIDYVRLADNEKAALRAVNDTTGSSHVAGMIGLMINMPVVAAPFFLLMHGEDTTIHRGTEITAFINGDMRLDLAKFGAAPEPAAPTATVQASLDIASTPAGADIEVDGTFVGHTPSTVALSAGSHKISLKKKGFADWSKTLNVASGTVNLDAVLEQAQAQ